MPAPLPLLAPRVAAHSERRGNLLLEYRLDRFQHASAKLLFHIPAEFNNI